MPTQNGRAPRTCAGLVDQIDEPGQRGWLGEIERLEHLLAGVDESAWQCEDAQGT